MSATPTTLHRTDWPAVLALFSAGLAASMQFGKVVPVLGDIRTAFGLDLVAAGLAVSILGLVGVFFAVSVGAIVRAIGTRRGILLALFGGALFAGLGAAAPSGPLFLASRLLEGFSHLLIVVCTPALMAAHATPKDKPIVLSIWACFFGLGFALVSAAATVIVPWGGWRMLLASHAGLLLVIGLCVWAALHRSGYHQPASPPPGIRKILAAHLELARSGTPLLLAILFSAYTLLFLTMLTFLGQYLLEVKLWSAIAVNRLMSVMAVLSMVFTLAAGVLVRLGLNFLTGTVAAFLALAACTFIIFIIQPGDMTTLAAVGVMMACFGLLPGFVMASVPQVAAAEDRAALTYAAIALFGNVGTFLGTPAFALFYGAGGWPAGAAFVIATALAGIGLAVVLKQRLVHIPVTGN